MVKMNIIENDRAIVNIDLMAALIIVMSIIAMIYSIPTISYNDKDWRVKQYIYTVRVTDSIVQDEGDPLWEINWTLGNYSGVKKIGFLYIDNNSKPKNKVSNIEKIKVLMGNGYKDNSTNTTWWEFPSPDNNLTIVDNASRALGLTGYSFYMQLHPVGLNNFDPTPLETNISSKNINFDIATVVDRYVYIIDPSIPDDVKYLKYDNRAIHYRLNLWVW